MKCGRSFIPILLFSFFIRTPVNAEISVAVVEAEPVCFTDENGRAAGLYPELLRHIFGEDELRFISGLSFHEAYEMVLDGKADIMPVFIKTDEREQSFAFNQEVVAVSWGQLFIAPHDRIEGIHDLRDQKIALLKGGQNGDNFIGMMKGFDIPFEPVFFDNGPEMTAAVLNGTVRGLVSIGSFQLSNDRLKASSILFSPTQAYLAVRKGGKEWILDRFDTALRQMKKDENSVYQREVDRWLVKEGESSIPRWVILLIITFFSIALVVFLFNVILRLRVRQIRERLQHSEASYKGLFNAAGEAILVIAYNTSRGGPIYDVNDSFCRLTGYSRDEILSLSILEYFGGEFKESLLDIMTELEEKGFSLSEMLLPTRSGGNIHVETSVRRFVSHGEPLLLAICRDLRDRDALNSALSAVEQKYTTIADYNYDWEFWMDENEVLIYLSPSCERISGYKAQAFYEDPELLDSLVHPEDRMKWRSHEHGTGMGHDKQRELVFRIIRRDGGIRWLEHQCLQIYSPEGVNLGIRGSFRDITRQKEMEEQLNRKQRLESLGILAGGVAHDFNNILSIIKGFSELGIKHPGAEEELKGFFETIHQASLRAENLTGKILDFSRNRKVELKAVRVSEIVEEIYCLIKASFPSTIEIRMNLNSDAFVLADEGQIHRVVMNICTNARLAMPEGGVLIMSVNERKADELPAGIGLEEESDCLELCISDTGVGMNEEVKARVFDPFFTTREGGQGSGMGLSVVHGIITGWNGHLSIESAPGAGTTLCIYLPLTEAPCRMERKDDDYGLLRNHRGLILVVDDEPLILKLVETYLQRAGMECDCCSSADEAFEKFKNDPASYSLVVADMTMPGMRGDQLAVEVKAIRPDLPVILCSGYSEYADPDKLPEGADALLGKPFAGDDLLNLIGSFTSEKV